MFGPGEGRGEEYYLPVRTKDGCEMKENRDKCWRGVGFDEDGGEDSRGF